MTRSGSPRRSMTLRLRLTLLYGGCFLIAGAALLGITYGLVSHDTAVHSQAGVLTGGGRIAFSSQALFGGKAGFGKLDPQVVTQIRSGPLPVVPPDLLNRIKRSGQAQINMVVRRAHAALALQRSQSLRSLLTKSGVALGIMALLSIGLGWLVAGRALRPLRTMNARARAITAESLHERLGLDGRRDELGELAGTFDALLARLESAFESQRRFVANASHELRTPLTFERAVVEVALADPDASTESLRHACERVLVTNVQQERLIDGLLTLARGQAAAGRTTSVDLAALAGELTTLREHETPWMSWKLSLEPAVVSGDPVLVERLIANLIDNAVAYNLPAAGWIRVQTGTVAGRARLLIANPGPPVPAERVEELFEPFRRLEGERLGSGAGGGAGLGLSIVRAIAEASHATVTAQPRADGGLEVEVDFPPGAGTLGPATPSLPEPLPSPTSSTPATS